MLSTCDFCARPAEFTCAGRELGFSKCPAAEVKVGTLIRILGFRVEGSTATEAVVTNIEPFGSRYLHISLRVAKKPGGKIMLNGSFRYLAKANLWVYGFKPCSKRFCEYCGCERSEGVHRCRLHWGIEMEAGKV